MKGPRSEAAAGWSVIAVASWLGCHAPEPRPEPPLSAVPQVTATEASAPRWRGDFETGNLTQWSYLLNPRGLAIVEAPVGEGRYAARVELQPGDLWPNGLNRVEVQYKPPAFALAEGQRSCFAWSFFLPATLSDARHQIGYWESYPSYQQLMSFEVRGQSITFVARLPSERVHWTASAAVTPDVWHRIGMCVRWSTDPAVGAVDVWFDGRQVVEHGAARTLWRDDLAFVQVGILRDVPVATEVMFLDAALEGATSDAVRASDRSLTKR